FRSPSRLEVSSCHRCSKARRCTCPRPCPESPLDRQRNYFRNRTASYVLSRKWKPCSEPSEGRTAPRTTRRSICTTPQSCSSRGRSGVRERSEEHTSELQSRGHLVCRLLLEKKKEKRIRQ